MAVDSSGTNEPTAGSPTGSRRAMTGDASVGELIIQMSDETSRLVRDEMQLARAEMKESLKHGGLGAGLFSAAGILALFGLGVLIATAIIALALVLPWWASALIIGVVLFVCAGIAGFMGKKQFDEVSPTPQRTIDNVHEDIREVKESRKHGHTH